MPDLQRCDLMLMKMLGTHAAKTDAPAGKELAKLTCLQKLSQLLVVEGILTVSLVTGTAAACCCCPQEQQQHSHQHPGRYLLHANT